MDNKKLYTHIVAGKCPFCVETKGFDIYSVHGSEFHGCVNCNRCWQVRHDEGTATEGGTCG